MSNDNEFPAKQVNTDFRKETATVVLKFSDDHGAESVVTLPQSSLPMLLAALHDKLEQGPVTPIDGQSLKRPQNIVIHGFQLQRMTTVMAASCYISDCRIRMVGA
jgi:hypothetical protein